MKISDLLRLSADNLRRRKGRTALTVIGVVVGTFAIIVLISLGIASNANNEAMLQSWGDLTQIQIMNYVYGSAGETPKLDDDMLATIRAQDHVVAATPYYSANNINGSIYSGKGDRYEAYLWNSYGVDMDALQAMEFQLQSGSWISNDLNLGKKKIPVLVGANMAYEFQDTRKSWNSSKRQRWSGQTDSLGNPIPPFVDVEKDKMILRLKAYDTNGNEKSQDFELVVMGVFVSDTSKNYFTESGIVMRISDMKMLEQTYEKLSGKKNSSSGGVIISGSSGIMREQDNGYQEVYVKVDDVDNVEDVENWLHDIGYEQTNSMTQIRNEMQASVAKSQMILGGTAAVALLVAALNIANTMMMSIYERTKEIGVMKVLGCEVGKIRTLFLVEAGSIGLLGGAIGVVLSYAASAILNNLNTIVAFFGGEGIDLSGLTSMMGGMMGGMGGSVSIIPPWLVLLGLGFSMLVGVLSGLWPAHRATKISALEAIRHE